MGDRPMHAAPGESINDREKVTETKVTERFRDMDRQNMANPAGNANVQEVTGGPHGGANVGGPQQPQALPPGGQGGPQAY